MMKGSFVQSCDFIAILTSTKWQTCVQFNAAILKLGNTLTPTVQDPSGYKLPMFLCGFLPREVTV